MQKIFLSAPVFLAFLVLFPFAAQAGRTGDMLADDGWASYGRPWVPSDGVHGSDMIPNVPNLLDENADLFDSMRPRVYYNRADMLPLHVPTPAAPYTAMFHPGPYMAKGQTF